MDRPTRYLLFTDLDGALLDHEHYDLEAARTTVDALRGRGVALICNSSKTDAEIRGYVEELGLPDPFIAEGGSLLFCPREYFPFRPEGSREEGEYWVQLLGRPLEELARAFFEMREALGLPLRAAFEMSDGELQEATDLPLERIPLMRARRASVPFLCPGPGGEGELAPARQWALARGLRYARGSRFHILTGPSDKGEAAALLARMYLRVFPRVVTVGVGDNLNDLPLLREVDHPIAIPTKSGVRPELAAVAGVRLAPAPGPAGWKAAIEALFRDLGQEIAPPSSLLLGGPR
ncbi:MAG: HAD hydrolase family protein [Nitrospinota bacterium]